MALTNLKESILTTAKANSDGLHNFNTGYGTVDASALDDTPGGGLDGVVNLDGENTIEFVE